MEQLFVRTEIKIEDDLPKIKGKYFCYVNGKMVEWDYNPDDKECGLKGSSKQIWLPCVEWYFKPISEEEVQNILCLYPRIVKAR
jgi:hypothetical protein